LQAELLCLLLVFPLAFFKNYVSLNYRDNSMKRVLIVDDELAVASIFDTALKNAGYEVKIATSGKGGLDLAKAEKFDLILLDQMIGDLSGNEVLKTLKQDQTTKATPVAMLTNFGHDTMVKEALYIGAVDYILKYQISIDDLIKKVKTILGDAS